MSFESFLNESVANTTQLPVHLQSNQTNDSLDTQNIFYLSTNNSTRENSSDYHFNKIVLGVGCFGVVFNILLVISLFFMRKVHESKSCVFIGALALSDFLVCGALVVFNIMLLSKEKEEDVDETWCVAWEGMIVFSCTASSLNIVGISVDRFLCLSNPFKYELSVTTKRLFFTVCIVFVLSVATSCLQFVPSIRQYKYCHTFPEVQYAVAMVILTVLLPCLIVFVMYFRILQLAMKHGKAIRRQSVYAKSLSGPSHNEEKKGSDVCETLTITGQTTHEKEQITQEKTRHGSKRISFASTGRITQEKTRHGSKRISFASTGRTSRSLSTSIRLSIKGAVLDHISVSELKACYTVALVAGTYLLCYFPFGVVQIVVVASDEEVDPRTRKVVLWLVYFNSVLNPFIYTFMSKTFRQKFCSVVRRYWYMAGGEEQASPDGFNLRTLGDRQGTSRLDRHTTPETTNRNVTIKITNGPTSNGPISPISSPVTTPIS